MDACTDVSLCLQQVTRCMSRWRWWTPWAPNMGLGLVGVSAVRQLELRMWISGARSYRKHITFLLNTFSNVLSAILDQVCLHYWLLGQKSCSGFLWFYFLAVLFPVASCYRGQRVPCWWTVVQPAYSFLQKHICRRRWLWLCFLIANTFLSSNRSALVGGTSSF